MRTNKTITYIVIILIILCLYQLLFTWKTSSVEKKAKALSEQLIKETPELKGSKLQTARKLANAKYLDSISTETVLNFGIKKYTYQDCKDNALNLGLDLQGGMNVVLQVNLKDLIYNMSGNSTDRNFNLALERAKAMQATSTEDFITLFERSYKEISATGRLSTIFSTHQNADKIKFSSSNEEVIKWLRQETSGAISNTYNIISARIDKFGVKSPTITLDANRGRINVELAGVDNPQRVRDIIIQTANLEFWETYTARELASFLNDANTALKNYNDYQKSLGKGGILSDSSSKSAASFFDTDTTASTNNPLTTKKDSLKKDTTNSKTKEQEKFTQENPLWSKLYPAIDDKNQFVDGPVVGYSRSRDTAEVNGYLRIPDVQAAFPADVKFLWSAKPSGDKEPIFQLYAIKKQPNDEKPPLDGGAVTDARKDIDQAGKSVVSMKMNSRGARDWERITGANEGKFVAIVLDDHVYSAPRVNERISGGTSQISGNFTMEEADDLANVLETGKLPAKAEIIEEDVIGPTLGKKAVSSGLISLIIAFCLILLYMVLYYNNAGLIADLVLFLNIFFIIGILAQFGASLTLPGIAGIVLTLGMAVDANVIINERIREELKLGKTLKTAISEGFKNSLSAIIDGNLTTIITAIILLIFGLGPIKGFATTLIIGILCSMLTAVLVAKEIFEKRVENGKTIKFETGFSKNLLNNVHFDFLGKRKWSYIFSCCTIVLGLISFFTKGFELGVDFKGGREYKVAFDKNLSSDDIKASLDKVFDGGTIVKTYGSANQFKISTSYLIDKSGESIDSTVERTLYNGLKQFVDGKTFESFKSKHVLSSSKVSPTISTDIKRSSIIAALLALVAMFLYIFIRFRRWQYSMGAIAATAHDTLFVLAIFSIFSNILPFSLEIDQAFIAAILTVIGYSINDTVVIFDRLREYLKNDPKTKIADVCNNAINSTLTRTINTSLTTIFVVIVLFLFGGESMKGFSFALIIGILIGTYSSIFIATPVMVDLSKDKEPETITADTKKKK